MVCGGLLQLVAYGAQDMYLTGDNYNIHFKIYYKKHIVENIVVGFEIYNVEFMGVKFVDFTSKTECVKMFNFGYKAINSSNCRLDKLPKFRSFDEFNKMTHLNCSKNNISVIKKINVFK